MNVKDKAKKVCFAMIQKTNFPHFSEYLFINLMNTLKMHNHNPTDLLSTEDDVVQWITLMEEEGLLTSTQVKVLQKDATHLNDVQHFRDECRKHFASNDSQTNLIDVLTKTTKATPLSFKIEDRNLIPIPSEGGSKGLLSLIAFQMLLHETNGVLGKVKACENEECLAFFVNQKGKRKWCSMEVCGNRTKAKKHYTKTKTSIPKEG